MTLPVSTRNNSSASPMVHSLLDYFGIDSGDRSATVALAGYIVGRLLFLTVAVGGGYLFLRAVSSIW